MMQHATYWGEWWKIQAATYVCVGTYPLEGVEEGKLHPKFEITLKQGNVRAYALRCVTDDLHPTWYRSPKCWLAIVVCQEGPALVLIYL